MPPAAGPARMRDACRTPPPRRVDERRDGPRSAPAGVGGAALVRREPAEPLPEKVRRRGADWSWGAAGSRATTGLSAVITSVMALLLLLKPSIAALNLAAHPKESVTFVLGGFAIGSSFYLVHLSMDLHHARWEAELQLRREEAAYQRDEKVKLQLHASAQARLAPRPHPRPRAWYSSRLCFTPTRRFTTRSRRATVLSATSSARGRAPS